MLRQRRQRGGGGANGRGLPFGARAADQGREELGRRVGGAPSAALVAALTALRVVAGSSAARARRRRVLSLLAYAVLPFVAALRQLVASGAGLSRSLT